MLYGRNRDPSGLQEYRSEPVVWDCAIQSGVFVRFSPKALVVNTSRRIARAAGGVLLSERGHEELLIQRSRAVLELTRLAESGLGAGLSCLIVSADRAIQLNALLETYATFVTSPVPTTVIYKASDERHDNAYREVDAAFRSSHAELCFIKERDGFRHTLINELSRMTTRNVLFLTDDNIFLRPVDLRFASAVDPLKNVLSLRHSPHLRRSYTAGVEQSPPTFVPSNSQPGLLEFRWFEEGNEWSDPWSLDGHVLSTAEVSVLTRISPFRAPNSYEAALKSFNDLARDRNGLCYPASVILNLPINRVQTEVPNRSGTTSAEDLLERWNSGLAIDVTKFESLIPQSTHEEHPIVFRRRG